MTTSEKITMVKTLANESDLTDDFVTTYLNLAKSAIYARLYPIRKPILEEGQTWDVPAEYEVLQCRLASRYLARRGGEGEIKHAENGIDRTYSSVNDEDLLMEVIQLV